MSLERALALPTAEQAMAVDVKLVAAWLAYQAAHPHTVRVSPAMAAQLAAWLRLLAPALERGDVQLP